MIDRMEGWTSQSTNICLTKEQRVNGRGIGASTWADHVDQYDMSNPPSQVWWVYPTASIVKQLELVL